MVLGKTKPSAESIDVFLYDVVSDRWTKAPTSRCAPPPRTNSSFTALGDESSALLWGGLEDFENTDQIERGWIFSLQAKN